MNQKPNTTDIGKLFMHNERPVCIYHGNCADGFGAAWVVWRAFSRNVELVSAVYGKDPPDVTDRVVYIVDFSYPREVLAKMASTARWITVLDHHKTAIENLGNINTIEKVSGVLDIEHSGAMLAWRYFFTDAPPPHLLQHIEDRDLWKFALPDTDSITANLFSYPHDMEVWDDLMSANASELVKDGVAIKRKFNKDLEDLLAFGVRTMWIGNLLVPVLNAPPMFASEAGHRLSLNTPFAATYHDTAKHRKFSLRSNKDGGYDVSEIAKQYGGGGHRNAAGFAVHRGHPLATC